MKREALNLRKFKSRMKGYSNLVFPTPIYPYVTRDVLVESFEVSAVAIVTDAIHPLCCRLAGWASDLRVSGGTWGGIAEVFGQNWC